MSTIVKEEFRDRLEKLIDSHIHLEELDNVFLAKRLYLSEAQFYRKVKKVYGESPNQLIRKIRLHRAHEYLVTSPETTVRNAAFRAGFTHVGYFIRRYKELFGFNPGELQRSQSR